MQGVGYRAACSRRAQELGLGGWVRNLPNGAVELEVEGPASQLHELRLWCERGPDQAQVTAIAVTTVAPTGHDWFEVRR